MKELIKGIIYLFLGVIIITAVASQLLEALPIFMVLGAILLIGMNITPSKKKS